MDLKLSGYIGENSDLFTVRLAGIKDLIIDMGGINYINSIGIKNWVLWTRKIPAGLNVAFQNCPMCIVNQMSMVVDFLPKGATVQSFYLPFFCDKCNGEKNILIEKGKDFQFATAEAPRQVKIPTAPDCVKGREPKDCELELDVIPDKYLAFLDFKP